MATFTIDHKPAGRRTIVKWDAARTADNATLQVYEPTHSLDIASVQVTGTFGSATVKIMASNDGTNFSQIGDKGGTAIALTSAGIEEISSGFRYYKPDVTGGTGDDLDITIVHWRDA